MLAVVFPNWNSKVHQFAQLRYPDKGHKISANLPASAFRKSNIPIDLT
jgi:hypothetical protein